MYNKNIYSSLYKRVYNDNKYLLSYMKMYFLLYDTMYNKNICCHYILSYIMTTNIFIIHESI